MATTKRSCWILKGIALRSQSDLVLAPPNTASRRPRAEHSFHSSGSWRPSAPEASPLGGSPSALVRMPPVSDRICLAVLALLALLFVPVSSAAQVRWSAEVFAGTAWSLPMPLLIRQGGEPDVRLRAHYSTRPWTGAPYYAYRFGRESNSRVWEAELVHHKLYWENPPPEVQHFEVSHGYNLVTANHAAMLGGGTALRFGFGAVIAHPEGRVRNRPVGPVRSLLGGGYHISGWTAQLAVGRRVPLSGGLFLVPEAKITASCARMPLLEGSATVPNLAVHALAGLGYAR